jgi:predicted RNase H-like nuclease (RuvC/YqgF family)
MKFENDDNPPTDTDLAGQCILNTDACSLPVNNVEKTFSEIVYQFNESEQRLQAYRRAFRGLQKEFKDLKRENDILKSFVLAMKVDKANVFSKIIDHMKDIRREYTELFVKYDKEFEEYETVMAHLEHTDII